MKCSELWIREWIHSSNKIKTTQQLINEITMTGLEVEQVFNIKYNFNNTIIGNIIQCIPYTNKKIKSIIKIDIGNQKIIDIIVYNTLNISLNTKVGVISYQDNNHINNEIIKKINNKNTNSHHEIHNIKQNSINLKSQIKYKLCSYWDLGLSKNNFDIYKFPIDSIIGEKIIKYINIIDNILHINIPYNRPDCLSILGIARNLHAYLHIPFKYPRFKKIKTIINNTISIKINNNHNKLINYSARIIKNINPNALTPIWMQERLKNNDIIPINNVLTNIANYVLLELGQPINIFDYKKIHGNITIGNSIKQEKFYLDETKFINIKSNTLIIYDKKNILSIAGILSNFSYNTTHTTNDIYIECAMFDPKYIYTQSQYYKIFNDTSVRYSQGVDPYIQKYALNRITQLILIICHGKAGPIINIPYNNKISINKKNITTKNIILLYRRNIYRIIGHNFKDQEIINILSYIQCHIYSIDKGWKVKTPSWRYDLKIEEDLIEEIAKIYGYNLIPKKPIYSQLNIYSQENITDYINLKNRIKFLLVDLGYQETINYSFVNPVIQNIFYPNQSSVSILNPISQDKSVMRLSLWTGLIENLIYNQYRQQKKIRLFEIGTCFIPNNHINKYTINQTLMISGIITGPLYHEHWDLPHKLVDFYDIKGDVENIIRLTKQSNNIKFFKNILPGLHPGQTASISLHNEIIGHIGVLHPEIKHKLNIYNTTVLFEINLDKFKEKKYNENYYNKMFQLNTSSRDISILIKNSISSSEILQECKKILIQNSLITINLIDVYINKNKNPDLKSLTIRLTIQNSPNLSKTSDFNEIIHKCITHLKNKFNAFIR